MRSNCLFEAVKAKLKDWKNVHILYLPPRWNGGHLHFFWLEGDTVYHFTHETDDESKQSYFFKGFVKKIKLTTFEASILHKMIFPYKKDNIKLAKKLHLPSVDEPGYLNWELYEADYEDSKNFPKKNKICKRVLISDGVNIFTKEIEDLKESDYKTLKWKYLSPYDNCWKTLSRAGW